MIILNQKKKLKKIQLKKKMKYKPKIGGLVLKMKYIKNKNNGYKNIIKND